jgi:hypothetical protein
VALYKNLNLNTTSNRHNLNFSDWLRNYGFFAHLEKVCNPNDMATCPTLAACGCELAIGVLYVRLVILLTETLWPSGLKRWLKAPFRKCVGSNPTGVTFGAWDVTICVRTCA